MSKNCGSCKWYDPAYSNADAPPEDQLGACEWPSDRLPWSLRWGNRERLYVAPTEGTKCPQYIETEPKD